MTVPSLQIVPSESPSSAEPEIDGFWVEPHNVMRLAPLMIPHIERAVARSNGEVRTGHILDAAERGEFFLSVATEGKDKIVAVCGSEFVFYPTGRKLLRVSLLGGNGMRRWIHLMKRVEEFARKNGCHAVQVTGRKGWGRVVSYPEVRRIFEKEL